MTAFSNDTDAAPTDPEDRKIMILARAARARTDAAQGACVRDSDGRTYAATSVSLAHLHLSAVAVAVAMAVSSGAVGLEAAALAAAEPPSEADLELLRALPGTGVAVFHTDRDGHLISTTAL